MSRTVVQGAKILGATLRVSPKTRQMIWVISVGSLVWSLLWSESESCSVVSKSLGPHELYSTWDYPGQKTGLGSLSFLQVIFPTQGLNPGLPHCRQILCQLSHQGSPSFFGLYQLNCPEGLRNPLQGWC